MTFAALGIVRVDPAAGQNDRFFFDFDAGADWRIGDSSTTNGGAAFGGGGTVRDVRFAVASSFGATAGYWLSPSFGLGITYEHEDGDVSWAADFAAFPGRPPSRFDGDAITDAVLFNAVWSQPVASGISLRLSGGAGAAFNRLQGVAESFTNSTIAHLADNTTASFAARASAGVSAQLTSALSVGVDGTAEYVGGYQTGDSRIFLGVPQAIGPYTLSPVWGFSLLANATLKF